MLCLMLSDINELSVTRLMSSPEPETIADLKGLINLELCLKNRCPADSQLESRLVSVVYNLIIIIII